MENEDYRKYLESILLRRRAINPRYSLRAFARDLGVNAPRLSEVLRGKKGLSLQAAMAVAQKLKLDKTEARTFCDLVQCTDARSPVARKLAKERLKSRAAQAKYEPLASDEFDVIADWYHFAILELTQVPGFRSDVKWIAKSLTISFNEAQAAIARLLRLKLLEQNSRGQLVKTRAVTTSCNRRSEAIRTHSKQILQKAICAIDEVPTEERDISTIMMPVNKKKWAEACEKIRVFRRELCAFLEEGAENEVHCLAIQLFPVSRFESIREKI